MRKKTEKNEKKSMNTIAARCNSFNFYQNTLHQLHHAEETLTHRQPTVLLPLHLVLAVATAR